MISLSGKWEVKMSSLLDGNTSTSFTNTYLTVIFVGLLCLSVKSIFRVVCYFFFLTGMTKYASFFVVTRKVTAWQGLTRGTKIKLFLWKFLWDKPHVIISFKISKNLNTFLENTSPLETLNNLWFQPTSLCCGSFTLAYQCTVQKSRWFLNIVRMHSWGQRLSVLL